MPADAPTPSAEAEGQSEMLPCPFCGGRPWAHENDWSEPSSWSVQCACLTVSKEALSRQEAIAAWNRRASAPPPTGDGGLREVHGADAAEALAFIQIGMELAFRQGLHEIGYDPVRVLHAALSAAPPQAQPGRGEPAGLQARLLDDARRIMEIASATDHRNEPAVAKQLAAISGRVQAVASLLAPPPSEGALATAIAETIQDLEDPYTADWGANEELVERNIERLREVHASLVGRGPPEGVLREALEQAVSRARSLQNWRVETKQIVDDTLAALSAPPREAETDALEQERADMREVLRGMKEAGVVPEEGETLGAAIARHIGDLAAPPCEAPRPDRAGAGAWADQARCRLAKHLKEWLRERYGKRIYDATALEFAHLALSALEAEE